MSGVENYLGQILSVLCAIIWAFAVILFKKSGETVHPIALNLFKNFIAIILFLITIKIIGQSLFRTASREEYLIFIVSGILGMAIADTLYFMCLNQIGAGLLAIVSCLHSPFIILLSFIFLRERMTFYRSLVLFLLLLRYS
ncbi:MAG: DMT family transporter [candidate division WOR-3 bacterium]